ncbi:hypothetical protein HG536_0D02570 [Torulaspora globosa]|uniref:mRNA m(6)A methyltransferase n=1 Tax=Torulaspora globosa TaxID=48254 RepID=A0A7G3ZGU9_9SACH|nr:uncharacterized protein HG536_0D02570 [Torulaspora globosa]QLL32735.1 hypothetical protein HG536_0D02570 [Torulaspora globosa]
MIDENLVRYLAENHRELLALPVSGQLRRIFPLYVMDCKMRDQDTTGYVFERFVRNVEAICDVAPGSLVFTEDHWAVKETAELEFVHQAQLQCLLNVLSGSQAKVKPGRSAGDEPAGLLDKLLRLVDQDSGEGLSHHRLLDQLQHCLNIEPASVMLGKERARKTVQMAQYVPVCADRRHGMLLSSAVTVVNNKITSVQSVKLSKADGHCPSLMDCLRSKIHYVPYLRPQTDMNLGDCSYLDTCHKLNTCRYVHYLQYFPESLKVKVGVATEEINKQIKLQVGVPFYTHGNCSADAIKVETPRQWIQCDVRKFDFSILGKFSAVVADPAWNIHMNLPYGTCNDVELLDLPLNQLQEEGLLFLWVTGRAIELGKESLQKWGYQVIHEIAWIKTNQLNRTIVTGRTGHWLNHSKEHLLVGLKGKPQWLNKRLDTDLIVSSTRETSRKPDELYGLIERLVGQHARKLEIFGRDHNLRPGWFTIGNQLTGTNIHEPDVKKRYEKFLQSQLSERQAVASYSNRPKTLKNGEQTAHRRTKATNTRH